MADVTNDRYRSGPRDPRYVEVKASEVINQGDFCDFDASGYLAECDANDTPTCVAMETITGGATDGLNRALVDFSTLSVYEMPPDAGTVDHTLIGKTMDCGGAQSVNIDATVDDSLACVDVDTNANTVFVRLVPVFAGV